MSESAASTLTTLRVWRRQRFQHALFVPGAAVLTLASAVGTSPPTVVEAVVAGVTAWLLLGGFRLEDDLVDRVADAVDHPERVLTRLSDARALGSVVAVVVLTGALLVAWLSGPLAGAIVVLLAGFLWLVAKARSVLGGSAEALVLLKYPVLIAVLANRLDIIVLTVMLLMYGVMCVDEAADRPSFRPLAATTCLASASALLYLLWPSALPFTAVQLALVAAACIGLWRTFSGPNTPWVRIGWMVWVVIQLLNFDLGHS